MARASTQTEDVTTATSADTTAETSTTSAESVAAPATTAQPKSEPFIVDGKEVSEEAYYKAAPGGGYIPERLREMNYRPAISTKKHGE